MNRIIVLGSVIAAAAACSTSNKHACGDNAAHYAPDIQSSHFPDPTKIDNPYFPLIPGTVFTYVDADNVTTTTTVTSDTKLVMGISVRVVHDVATAADGSPVEDTLDYFAQDQDGVVWYFGEDTTAYSGSMKSTAGSWVGGVDCALPGIQMPASPMVGFGYRQEYLEGSAEDEGAILNLTQTVVTPLRTFSNCIETQDTSGLEPGAIEHKFYCPDFGLVSSVDVAMPGGTDKHEDLVAYSPGPGAHP
jgi:hypothetical protein